MRAPSLRLCSIFMASSALTVSEVVMAVVASVERFAYKGVASNLVTYLTDVVEMSTSAAAKSVSTWSGVTFMLPLVSAVLADSYWNRYSTITASSLLYVVVSFLLVSSFLGSSMVISLRIGHVLALFSGVSFSLFFISWALLHAWMPCSTLFLPLYLISIGQGGYNPSLQAFGADQLDMGDDAGEPGGGGADPEPEESGKVKSKFFRWWYFGICSGSLLGNSVMSYIQDTVGWGLGFAIPCAVMALSVAAFFCCTPLYKQTQAKARAAAADRPPPASSSSSSSSPASVFRKIRALRSLLADAVGAGAGNMSLPSRDDDGDKASELELQEKPLKSSEQGDEKLSVDDEARGSPGVGRVILRLFPIWAMLLMFAVIFQQPMTFFTKQGMLMDHRVGAGGGAFVVPPAMLQSAITVSIILLMPAYDGVIAPLIGAVTRGGGGGGRGITVLQRIGVGMVLSVVAMVVAAVVEARRRRCSALPAQPPLSIFWLLPQYVLLGVSDVFTVVGMQEFFYTQVPSAMRTTGIALYLSVFGVGSFLGAFLITALEGTGHGWFSDDPREARLDNYYWFLALLSAISFGLFTHLCKYYDTVDEPAGR